MLSSGEFAPISSASKPCWTCVRRRVKCDFGLPTCFKCRRHGRECLGYGPNRPLVWTGGACRRMTKRRKADGSYAHPTTTKSLSGGDVGHRIPHSTAVVSANPADPIFQGLNLETRRNVEYCESFSKKRIDGCDKETNSWVETCESAAASARFTAMTLAIPSSKFYCWCPIIPWCWTSSSRSLSITRHVQVLLPCRLQRRVVRALTSRRSWNKILLTMLLS